MAIKVSAFEIFEKIRPLMCSISTPIGESSGFILTTDGVVLTVAHNIPLNLPNLVQINHIFSETPFFPSLIPSINMKNVQALDMYAFKTDLRPQNTLPILPDGVGLYEGMKVYFAGFPLGHEKITFHKGLISSLIKNQGVEEFTIDGTVVPGNSGGPVVAMHNSQPHLIGIITSELADFSPEDLKTIAIMKALKEKKETDPQNNQQNVLRIDGNGLSIPIKITTPQGEETVVVNDRDTTALALDLIQKNLSTGIGKAVDIRKYINLTSETSAAGTYFFPTGKGKGVITGNILNKDKKEILKHMEVRYGKGKGPRGIRIVMSDGSGTYLYKFLQNPHTGPGNYNKNQKELYDNAALEFTTQFLQQKSIPQSFNFNACQAIYTAELQ